MKLRRATMDDAIDVLAWRNDPKTIAMSKTPGAISQAEHLRWFAKTIEDPSRAIFIASEGTRKLGMIRFDRSNGAWLVSINVAPSERGKGYAYPALDAAIRLLTTTIGPCAISAEIRHDNLASIRIFEKCGFQLNGTEGDFLHWIRVVD